MFILDVMYIFFDYYIPLTYWPSCNILFYYIDFVSFSVQFLESEIIEHDKWTSGSVLSLNDPTFHLFFIQ